MLDTERKGIVMSKKVKLSAAAFILLISTNLTTKAQIFDLEGIRASDIDPSGAYKSFSFFTQQHKPQASGETGHQNIPAVPLPTAISVPLQPAAYNFWGRKFEGSPIPGVGTSGLLPVTRGHLALLTSGEEAFSARLKTLQNARRSIRIQALIFTADESGMAVAKILKEKHKQGLDVRVIVDAFSNLITSKKKLDLATQFMYYDLKQNGIEVEGYEALLLQWLNEISFHDPRQPDKRLHDKMWIIDAEDPASASAVVGGMNIANEYFRMGNDAGHRWRDQDFLVTGEVVNDITTVFERNYAEQKKIKHSRPGLWNTDRVWELWRKYIVMNFGMYTPPAFKPDEAIQGRVNAIMRGASDYTPELLPAKMRFLQSRPRVKETYILQAYEDLCASARKELLIVNAYFIPTPRILAAIKGAARRGVAVTIITISPATNDLPEMSYASRYTYHGLLAVNHETGTRNQSGSIRIAEWAGHKFSEGTMHAKFAVSDRKYVIGGSYNLDPRSESLNSETVIEFENETLAARLAENVAKRDLPKCEVITKEQAAAFHNPKKAPDILKLLLWNGLRGEL